MLAYGLNTEFLKYFSSFSALIPSFKLLYKYAKDVPLQTLSDRRTERADDKNHRLLLESA